ncbi:MAG: DUF1194 domain-containing protein [Hyphomicrobiaceae bacterium]
MRPKVLAPLIAAMLCLPGMLTADEGERRADVALVLAIDCSDSIIRAEYELQMQGLAEALRSAEVIEAIAALPSRRIVISVFHWAGGRVQELVLPWTPIGGAAEAEAAAGRIAGHVRYVTGETSISGAIEYAVARSHSENPYRSLKRVVDISGDGVNSDWRPPEPERDRAVRLGIVINGLAILSDEPKLGTYYLEHIAGGPGSFVMTARDALDYRDQIRRKLLREIALPVS